MISYQIDHAGRLIIPDAATLTSLNISGRRDIKSLPPLPLATEVYARDCTGLTALDLPLATRVDASGCTGLTALDLPLATTVDASDCTNIRSFIDLCLHSGVHDRHRPD